MNEWNVWTILIVVVVFLIALALGAAAGYYFRQIVNKNAQLKLHEESEHILNTAKEQALAIELEAKDHALEIRQSAEQELVRKRNELSREEDRLQKRREEMDNRTDRLEKREQAINKRQSFLDKRGNDIEKLYKEEMEELPF